MTRTFTRFPGRSRINAAPYRALPGGSDPNHSWGASLMLDVLFVGVTILVFVVLALIVKAVEKL